MTQTLAPFRLEALVDFVDDALTNGRPLTAADLDALMVTLKGLGVRRVSWGYYADGRGGLLTPAGFVGDYAGGWGHYASTYRTLGNPLQVAVEAGHRHGLEVYAYFKPYETGPGLAFPTGSPLARDWGLLDCIGGKLGWLDPFVREHPELRIQRRGDDLPVWAVTATVSAIRLSKQDAASTRITREHVQIWTSPDNWQYRPAQVDFAFTNSVEPAACEVRDHGGNLLVRRGDPVRVLTLSGLNMTDKYILVTTDFTDGPGDFTNSGLALMSALDGQGREIPGTFASGSALWCRSLVDLRQGGLSFDVGFGAAPVTLDLPNADGKQGFVAFTRGRNACLPGALCETEPEVQAFWLRCLEEMIAVGVDGVDVREENHSTHTDCPQDYGFNPVVLAQCGGLTGAALLARIAEVRGNAYTDFLRQCKVRLAQAGKRLRYNLQLDFFRPHPPADRLLAYPANICFDWPRWVDEGVLDEAILRFYALPLTAIFDDAIAHDMIAHCQARGIPIVVNRYIGAAGDNLAAEVQRVRVDGRFSGFIFYEANSYAKFGPAAGTCSVVNAAVAEAAAAATA